MESTTKSLRTAVFLLQDSLTEAMKFQRHANHCPAAHAMLCVCGLSESRERAFRLLKESRKTLDASLVEEITSGPEAPKFIDLFDPEA